MTQMREPARQAAHVLVDTVTAFDEELGETAINGTAMNLALARINEVGAVTATMNDETDELHMDASDLLGGAIVSINWLAALAAELGKTSREHVLAELREFIDSDHH